MGIDFKYHSVREKPCKTLQSTSLIIFFSPFAWFLIYSCDKNEKTKDCQKDAKNMKYQVLRVVARLIDFYEDLVKKEVVRKGNIL